MAYEINTDPQPEVYKITSTDDQGNEIVAYVKPEGKSAYIRSVSADYGMPEIVPMMMSELPSDAKFAE